MEFSLEGFVRMATFGKTPPREGEELDHLLDLPAPERDALMIDALKAMPTDRLTMPRKNGKTSLIAGLMDDKPLPLPPMPSVTIIDELAKHPTAASDPLTDMPVATSDPESLIDDMKPPKVTHYEDSWALEWSWPLSMIERRDPISQARRDDAALPQTRFGDYPSD